MNQFDGGSGSGSGGAGTAVFGPNGTGGGMGGNYGAAQSPPPKSMFSFNKFVVEPYVSDGTVKTASAGRTEFARIEQKVTVKGLRLLVDLTMSGSQQSTSIDGLSQSGPTTIKAGSIVFIREELLHTQPWAKTIFESEYLGKFMLVDKQHIEFVSPI